MAVSLNGVALAVLLWWQAEPQGPDNARQVIEGVRRSVLQATPRILMALGLFLAFIFLAWLGKRTIALAAPRVRADTGTVLLLSRVYYYGIITFGAITALATLRIDVSALIAGLGLTGFALGFALKDVLSNLVAGIMLLVYRPFDIGDYIEMGVYHGRIETIRMRDTIVRDREDRLIVIPNTKLITEVVVNNRDRTDRSRHVAAQPPVVPPLENTYDDIKTEVKI